MTDQPEQRDPGARRVDQDDPAPERAEANDVSTAPRVLGGRYEVGEKARGVVHVGRDLAGNLISADAVGRPTKFQAGGFSVYKAMPSNEHYFGLGDKPGPLDRRNEAFTDWNTDAFGWQESTDPIYKSIPYFMTFRKGVAAGIFLDNTWRASFDFNKEYRDGYSFGSEGGPLDLYILYGPEPKTVVQTWAWLTGTTPMSPANAKSEGSRRL